MAAERSATARRFDRLPSLDGWRAISILLVLAAHCKLIYNFPQSWAPPWLEPFWTSGNLGVRFFFVISGFLITYLLMREFDETGRVSLNGFYIRRALRILPVYCAFLLVVFGLQLFTEFRQSTMAWIGNATFTTDFFPSSLTTTHLWSLSVEEQFYLLWPVTFALIGFRRKRRLCVFLALAIIVAPICRFITSRGMTSSALFLPFFQTYSFLNYFDCLAMGCLTAILLVHYREWITVAIWRFPVAIFLLALFVIVVPGAMARIHRLHAFTAVFATSLQSLGFTLLILQSVLFPKWFKPLNWPVMQRIGILSYSIYVWQELFCTDPKAFGAGPIWWLSFPGWLVPVFLVAAISFYGFEKPLMGLRARFRRVA